MAAIGRTETVRAQGEKLLDARHIRLAESVQLTDLHQPDPCKSSEASLPSKVRMLSLNQPRLILSSRVLLPMPWGPARMSMLSYLLPGTMAPGDGGGESLAGHRSGIGAVLRSQVVNEKGVQAGHAVPLEALEVVLDLVESVLCGVEGEGPIILPLPVMWWTFSMYQ